MSRLVWGDKPPMYDLGLDHGVLYLDDTAVPWNGLVSVDEKEMTDVNADFYFEGNRLHVSQLASDFEARISAYTYPDLFAEYNGYSDRHIYRRFGMSYRTQHGEDHRLHLVYNALVKTSDRSWTTVKESVDPSLFNWDIYATAVDVPGARPASHLIMEVPRESGVFDELEDILYGTDTTDPRLPDPEELVDLYESATLLRIIYNGDGSYTATGPDEMVTLLEDGRFALTAPSVFLLSQDIFVVNSY